MPKYGEYTLATDIADTDLVLIKTAGGTKSTTFLNLKIELNEKFQDRGLVIWGNTAGANIILIVLTQNKHYKFYTNTMYNQVNFTTDPNMIQIKDIFLNSLATWPVVIPIQVIPSTGGIIEGSITINDTSINCSPYSPPQLKIYKIVQLD